MRCFFLWHAWCNFILEASARFFNTSDGSSRLLLFFCSITTALLPGSIFFVFPQVLIMSLISQGYQTTITMRCIPVLLCTYTRSDYRWHTVAVHCEELHYLTIVENASCHSHLYVAWEGSLRVGGRGPDENFLCLILENKHQYVLCVLRRFWNRGIFFSAIFAPCLPMQAQSYDTFNCDGCTTTQLSNIQLMTFCLPSSLPPLTYFFPPWACN